MQGKAAPMTVMRPWETVEELTVNLGRGFVITGSPIPANEPQLQ